MKVLSPRQLAQAIGVSESSLKRWADSGQITVSRTSGGHRRITLTEAIRFIRATRATVVKPEILGLSEISAIQRARPSEEDELTAFTTYLKEGREAEARGLFLSSYLSGRSIAELGAELVQPALEAIGEIWRHGMEGVFIEHRATDICIQAISQVRLMQHAPDDAPVAVGGAPSGDVYLLPSLLSAAVLAGEGYRAINLGPDSPADALLHAAHEYDAALVWLSISAELESGEPDAIVRQLSVGLQPLNAMLIVGGRLARRQPLPTLPNVHYAEFMTELVALACGLRKSALNGRSTTARA
jgi:methanogenic corrinoid protein MtbC1